MSTTEDAILVTTDITKDVRRAFFHAAFGGSGVLFVHGAAGTGKTETCKDICAMLGLSAAVFSAVEGMASDGIEWVQLAQQSDVLIIDCVHHLPKSVIEDAIRAAKDARIPLCLTSGQQDTDWCTRVLGDRCTRVQTLVPAFPIILSSMMACEGMQQADDLADRLNGCFNFLQANSTKQTYYDWGLRKMKSVTKEVGNVARAGHFIDERQTVAAAMQTTCAPSMAPLDEVVLHHGLIRHFGADAFVHMSAPTDFWNAAAAKISQTVSRRHGSLCLPVLESDEPFVMAVIEEEARKVGATAFRMPGTLAGMSADEIFGHLVDEDYWIDGCFSQNLRDIVNRDRPGWLVVFCGAGKLGSEKWAPLNTLLDDNKCLHLASGEIIRLRPDHRIIFAAPSIEASPATVSRLGVINLEEHHRHRL